MTQTNASASGRQRPPTIVIAAVLLVAEALSALAYAVLEVGQIRMSRPVVGIGVTVLMAAFGLLLLLVARGVFRGRRWSRGPAVATQLILFPVAWSFVGGQTTWVFVILGMQAIVVLLSVLHPRSTALFVPRATDRRQE